MCFPFPVQTWWSTCENGMIWTDSNFTLNVNVNRPQNNRDFNQGVYTSYLNLTILAWTGPSCRADKPMIDTRTWTDGHTDAINDDTGFG